MFIDGLLLLFAVLWFRVYWGRGWRGGAGMGGRARGFDECVDASVERHSLGFAFRLVCWLVGFIEVFCLLVLGVFSTT